jgi:hypothetical protein
LSPGLRSELEALRDGGPVDEERMRGIALAALRWVPIEWLVLAIGWKRGLALTRIRLTLYDDQLGEVEDLTPDEGWSR